MYDKNYVLGIRIREIDGGGSSDDFSMATIKHGHLLPKMKYEGMTLTDQTLSIFIRETESEVPVTRDVTVEPSLSAKAGATLSFGDNVSASADYSMGAKYP